VATKSLLLGSGAPGLGTVGLSFTVGYGNGLFSNHGSIPVQDYASVHTGGLFFGVNANVHPTVNTLVTIMAENDAWDDNIAAAFTYRGLRAEIALIDVGARTPVAVAGGLGNRAAAVYNYTKAAFSIGWQGNVLGVLRGDLLASRVAQLRARRKRLAAELARHEARITQLKSEIASYESQSQQDLDARRAQVEDEIRAEQAELDRLNNEVRRIEQQSGGKP
jgi:hypothetical protein